MQSIKPFLIAHRGYSTIAPENTHLAFRAAWIFGFDGVELDVHQTKDEQLVIIHDETVNRTSNGRGKVKNLTLRQLQKLDFGFRFAKKLFQPETIMTLEQFLKTFGNVFKVINIEVKTNVFEYPQIESRIFRAVEKIKPKAKIIYSSFNFKSLQKLAQISHNLNLAFLFLKKKDLKLVANEVKQICSYLNPWFKSYQNPQNKAYYDSFNLNYNWWTFDLISKDSWTKGSRKMFAWFASNKQTYSLICNEIMV